MSRTNANSKMLNDTEHIQNKTEEAIVRIQKHTAETEALGAQTLEQLRLQDQKLDAVEGSVDQLSNKQTESQNLQKRFDFLSLNWGGNSAAEKKAQEELALRAREERKNIKELYQQERFDPITRTWKRANMVLCTDPNSVCDEIFDPYLEQTSIVSKWVVDYNGLEIDKDGWTYAFDFATLNRSGKGESTPKWNSYVRRRKWKLEDSLNGVKTVFAAVTTRLDARKEQIATAAQNVVNAGKELQKGYVPRDHNRNNKNNSFKSSGLSSAGMLSNHELPEDQRLNDNETERMRNIHTKNEDIDRGITQIDHSIDRIHNIANTMKEEVINQNEKINRIGDKMDKAGEKQVIINAKLKHSVDRN